MAVAVLCGAHRARVWPFVRVMAEWTEEECEEWLLGEKKAGSRTIVCPADVKDILLDGFKDDVWDEGDVPSESSPLTARDEKVMLEILDACAEKLTKAVGKPDRMRFVRWLAAREDEDVDDGAVQKYKPSAECKADMEKQGARSYGDLLFLDQSLYLGRPAGKGDLVDAEYGSPPSKSKGGKDAVKYKAETFATELAAAKKQNSTHQFQAFVMATSTSLSASDHPFASVASTRIMQWFMKGKRAMQAWGPLAELAYFEEYVRTWRGRGIPLLYDSEIASHAQGVGAAGGEGPSVDRREGPKQKGRQQSEDASSDFAAMASQMSELVKAQAAMSQSVGTLGGQVSNLMSEVSNIKSGGGMGGGGAFVPFNQRTCNNCGETGHIAANRVYWNLKNVTEMLYGIPVRVLSVASWFHWSGMLLVSYYDHSGSKNAAGRYPMTHT